jgi:glutamine synthetase
MYLGDQLADVIEQLEKGTPTSSRHSGAMRIGADTLPPLPRDATDRNRTSPFAFTGNKFEFRAPGSSQSCSGPNTILNTIVAEAFDQISEVLEKLKPADFNAGLQKQLQKIIKAHKRIIFNGNGYTEEWVEEAAKRGLPNAKTTMEALRCLTVPANIALLEKYGVYSKRELESRYEVFLEEFHRRIRIEGEITLEIASSIIAPAVAAEYGKSANALASAKEAGLTVGLAAVQKNAAALGAGLDELYVKTDALKTALGGCHEEIVSAMLDLRTTVDGLEKLVADESWPLPKYREMLFVY